MVVELIGGIVFGVVLGFFLIRIDNIKAPKNHEEER